MRILMFYHSLLSDWNHGNAHFLRGVATELCLRGHEVIVYEPRDSWSLRNLVEEHGTNPVRQFHAHYPLLKARRYLPDRINLDKVLDNADMVIVHEWNDHKLVAAIGRHHKRNPAYRLYFHDTHHRMVTQPESMAAYDLSDYDGVLAYGKVLEHLYKTRGNVRTAWTWHEAADTRRFFPVQKSPPQSDIVWVGNWGDDERALELSEFLFDPIESLGLKATVHGVRYPDHARASLAQAGIAYGGWLANFDAPRVFAQHKLTVHVPRRPYVKALPGIPTIRPFEALACGIPLVCSPWDDAESLFRPGRDYLVARNGAEMRKHMSGLVHDSDLRQALATSGLETIRRRHTCGHRVEELLAIDATLRKPKSKPVTAHPIHEPSAATVL